MNYFVVGLGNPGKEYENSRHNAGRSALEYFGKKNDFPSFQLDKKSHSLVSKNRIATLILPETFMNKSGSAVSYFVKSKKSAGNLLVIYDDIDLPLGTLKISWNKNSGGHKGLESIIKAVKTKEFTRIRIGISPSTLKSKAKKPEDEKKVLDFILGDFKLSEGLLMKKSIKTASKAISAVIREGRERATNQFNGSKVKK